MPVTHETTGSNPVASAIYAAVAQSVEQRTENPRVGGSIPSCGTTMLSLPLKQGFFFAKNPWGSMPAAGLGFLFPSRDLK